MCQLSAVTQTVTSRHLRLISSISVSLQINLLFTKDIGWFLTSLYSDSGVNVKLCYSFTDHHLKAKLFAMVLIMYRKASDSNYAGTKKLSKCLENFFGSRIIYQVAFINKYERTELKSRFEI